MKIIKESGYIEPCLTSFLYNKAKIACLRLPFYFMFWKKQVGNLLCAETFDVIHIHDLPLAEVGYWAKKKFGIKICFG